MKIRHLITAMCLAIFLFGGSSSVVQAQSKAFIKAEKYFSAGGYYQAIDLYREAYGGLSEKTNKGDIFYKIAECYRMVNEPVRAEQNYLKAIGKKTTYSLAYFYLAEMQKMNQKYEDAKESFKKYKELEPEDKRADDYIRSCELAQKWIESPNGYIIENMKFFNSKQSDFAPAIMTADNMSVVYTSSRESDKNKTKNPVTGEPNAHLYVSKMDRKGVWSKGELLPGCANTEQFEEGNACFSKDFKNLYFTRCDKVNKLTQANHIYMAELLGEETWDNCKKVNLVGDSISVGSPAISPDNLTLYFTANMDGGMGGNDLWKVTRESASGEWGQLSNLGPQINTKGDEAFPFVHADETLYFSSNGLVGMGGLDVFKAKALADGTWKVENMGYPINSSADDFGIVFQSDTEKGYLTSSRTLKGDDDVYTFVLPPLKFNVIGTVRDEKTNEPLANASVRSISSDGLQTETKTDKTGVFRFPLKLNTDYVFIASHEGYLNGKQRETTKGLGQSTDLKPIIKLASFAKPIELPNILYDFAKWDLRPESMVSLDKLVETLNDNPGIVIEIMSHTDARGGDADNQTLSQKRAQSVVDYLISKSIAAERLQAKGYGESTPRVVDTPMAQMNTFLKDGATLNEAYINTITDADFQEIAHQLNRRTEFRVLSADYKPKK